MELNSPSFGCQSERPNVPRQTVQLIFLGDKLRDVEHINICDICKRCLNYAYYLYWKRPPDEAVSKYQRHHWSFSSLEASCGKNCYICLAFMAECKETLLPSEHFYTGFRSKICIVEPSDNMFLFQIRFKSFRTKKRDCYVNAIPGDVFNDRYSNKTLVESHGKHFDPWKQIINWTSDCIGNHEKCSLISQLYRTSERSWYPTRLIDLGDPEQWLAGKISAARLIITNEVNFITGSYATLSHSWGGLNVVKLTMDSLETFKTSMPIDKFPKTYLDAMEVNRRLKIRYLWIDSLCIIQQGDQLEDWLREASVMQNVYANSACNISALGAKDGTKGLFFDQNLSPISTKITLSPTNVSRWRLKKPNLMNWIRKRTERKKEEEDVDFYLCSPVEWEDMRLEPANTRAWCLQERYLAPRSLHFGENRFYFECCEARRNFFFDREVCTRDNKYVNLPKDLDFLGVWEDEESGEGEQDEEESKNEEALWRWNALIEDYSKRSLTKSEDKLVAVSGLAKIFQQGIGGEYIAGLWRKHLVEQLMWCRQERAYRTVKFCKKFATYSAPSFSWASLDGPVTHGYRDEQHEMTVATIVDVKIEPVTSDATGQVRSGFIRIRSHLKRFKLPHITTPQSLMVGNIRVTKDTAEDMSTTDTYLLPLYRNDIYIYVEGLILHSMERPGLKGCFERIGTYRLEKKGLLDRIGEWGMFKQGLVGSICSWCLKKSAEEVISLGDMHDEDGIPCESYDPQTKEYTIVLV